ncbi:MAG TPA: hypothetical protein VGS10_07215 [Terracidiphilus sp.]|nr:hypothetical protein [Terracidiphilus sp.]
MNDMSEIEDVHQALQDFLAPELRAITARIDALEKVMIARFDLVDQNFASVDVRFDSVDVKFESIHKEIQALGKSLDIERRLAALEAKQVA